MRTRRGHHRPGATPARPAARSATTIAGAFALGALLLVAGCQQSDLGGGPTLGRDEAPVGPGDPCPAPSSIPVGINEVQLVNLGTIAGPGGEFLPWLELHNPSVDPFDLGGATITDDLGAPEKWELPCGPDSTIGGGEFLVLFFSDEALSADDLIIDFLPDDSGAVFLSLIGTGTLETVTIDADALAPGAAAGRSPDGTGAFVLLLAPTPGAANSDPLFAPPATFVRGDIDADGDVDADDLALLNSIVFGGSGDLPACEDRLDVNDDGEVDIADANFLAIALAPGGPTIPPPFPGAATDPTPDEVPCESEVTP